MVLQKIAKISCQSQFNKSSECLYCTFYCSFNRQPQCSALCLLHNFFISRAIKKIFLNKPSTLIPSPLSRSIPKFYNYFCNNISLKKFAARLVCRICASSKHAEHKFYAQPALFYTFKKTSIISPLPYLEVFQNSTTIFAIIFIEEVYRICASSKLEFLPIKHPFILSHPFTFYLKAEYVSISKQFSKLDN